MLFSCLSDGAFQKKGDFMDVSMLYVLFASVLNGSRRTA